MFFTKEKKEELNKKNFKILSIDGGGLKGIFSAYAVLKLREEYNIDLYDEFDMFVGTSTGSLIVASILTRENPKEIFDIYNTRPNKIFFERYDLVKQIRTLFYPQFNNSNFRELLEFKFKDLDFDDFDNKVKKPYIFASTNLSEAKPIVFCSKHFSYINNRYKKILLKDAIYSSCAAPFYFEPILEEYTNDILIDGGLWANNPSNLAITYAVGDLGVKLENISLLSFGQTFTENIKIKVEKGKNILKEPDKSQLAVLFTSSLVSRQNFDSLSSMILLKERLYRYAPEKDFPENKVSFISDSFIEYLENYWEENKESLVKFIKENKNLKYSFNEQKRYN